MRDAFSLTKTDARIQHVHIFVTYMYMCQRINASHRYDEVGRLLRQWQACAPQLPGETCVHFSHCGDAIAFGIAVGLGGEGEPPHGNARACQSIPNNCLGICDNNVRLGKSTPIMVILIYDTHYSDKARIAVAFVCP